MLTGDRGELAGGCVGTVGILDTVRWGMFGTIATAVGSTRNGGVGCPRGISILDNVDLVGDPGDDDNFDTTVDAALDKRFKGLSLAGDFFRGICLSGL